MKKKIEKINQLLINHFGIPPRSSKKSDPVDTIIATILSQNTNDNNSYKAYINLKQNFKNWDELALLKPSKIEKYIKVAGLGKQKSKSIYELLQSLKKENTKISLDFLTDETDEKIIEKLTSFRGIGVKTASCVLLFSLRRNICPVDTHVHRTLNRIGLVSTSNPEKTFYLINPHLPEGTAHSFHTNLIKLGRIFCKPSNLFCGSCPVKRICKFDAKNIDSIPSGKSSEFLLLDSLG